jgi:hypothetical protein
MWRVALSANTLRRGAYARNNVVSLQSKGQCYGVLLRGRAIPHRNPNGDLGEVVTLNDRNRTPSRTAASGHFQTKSEAALAGLHWSGPAM